jgi:hypothetical protein
MRPSVRVKEAAMLRWKMLACAGVAFGVAGLGWGYAQQRTFPGFYELRIYKAQPDKRDALAARFATRTSAIYARYNITNVGYFIPLQSDPEFREVVISQERDEQARLIVKVHNIDMTPSGTYTAISVVP